MCVCICYLFSVCVRERKQEAGQKVGLKNELPKGLHADGSYSKPRTCQALDIISEGGGRGVTDSWDYAIKRCTNPGGLVSH